MRTEKQVRERLESSIGLEYTRDSPLFRQQVALFSETFDGLDAFATNVGGALSAYQEALGTFAEAQTRLAYALQGKDKDGYSMEGSGGRCLFTNALPNLQDLSDTLHAVASTLKESAKKSNDRIQERIQGSLLNRLEEIRLLGRRDADLGAADSAGGANPNPNPNPRLGSEGGESSQWNRAIAEMERLYNNYERSLGQAMLTGDGVADDEEMRLVEGRRDYELARFNLVADLNMLDSRKKLLLSELAVDLYRTVLDVHQGSADCLSENAEPIVAVESALEQARLFVDEEEDMWDIIRARVDGELTGSAPPPKAPPGALSPMQPRRHVGMNRYTAQMFTEVLRSTTRVASYEERRHAHDEGVFKQGFLYTIPSLFSFAKRRRVWHRLYGTKLYTVERPDRELPSCELVVVCDVSGATVSARPALKKKDMPYVITINTAAGKKFELQAENQDELVAWIQAIRRCASRLQGSTDPRLKTGARARTSVNAHATPDKRMTPLPAATSSNTSNTNTDTTTNTTSATVTSTESDDFNEDGGGVDMATSSDVGRRSMDIVPAELVCQGRAALLLLDVIQANPKCAECSAEPVTWLSTSLGVTLCEECAAAHRQLTWSVSKLKSLRLDDFSCWQLEMVLACLGNEVGAGIWEISIPHGWSKPLPTDSTESKTQFILAKYQWFAFVDEVRMRGDAQLAEGLAESSRTGEVPQCMWWISHVADVNSVSDVASGLSPLHYAVEHNRVHTVAFLLLNGSNIFAPDSNGQTPLDYTRVGTGEEAFGELKSLMEGMMQDIIRGDY